MLGVYNAFARIPLAAAARWPRGSQASAWCRSIRCCAIGAHEPARREAWLRDQYQHPEEHRHTLAEVQRWFAENGVEYLRTYPSAVLDDEPERAVQPRAATTGGSRAGWRSSAGCARSGAKAACSSRLAAVSDWRRDAGPGSE